MHNPRRRLALAACGLTASLVGAVAVTATATHGGLHGLFNSRGTINELKIHDRDGKLKLSANGPLDVAVVGAQLDPHAQTGWHQHPADSIVTVRPGGPALKMVELPRRPLRRAHLPAG